MICRHRDLPVGDTASIQIRWLRVDRSATTIALPHQIGSASNCAVWSSACCGRNHHSGLPFFPETAISMAGLATNGFGPKSQIPVLKHEGSTRSDRRSHRHSDRELPEGWWAARRVGTTSYSNHVSSCCQASTSICVAGSFHLSRSAGNPRNEMISGESKTPICLPERRHVLRTHAV